MGEKHGAEICELVGLNIMNGINIKVNRIKVGIYIETMDLQRSIKVQVGQRSQNQEENAQICKRNRD